MSAKRTLKYCIYVTQEELNRIRLYAAVIPHTESSQDILRAKVLEEVDKTLSKAEFDKLSGQNTKEQ